MKKAEKESLIESEMRGPDKTKERRIDEERDREGTSV